MLLLLSLLLNVGPHVAEKPKSDIHRCIEFITRYNLLKPEQMEVGVDTYDGYLGFGLDFLTEEKTLAILAPVYRRCRTVGRFLIPDYAQPTAGHTYSKDNSTTTMNSIQEYESTKGIKVGVTAKVGFSSGSASGTVSTEHRDTQKSFQQHDSMMTRTVMSLEAFTVSIAATNGALSTLFLDALERIRDADEKYARYFAQILVRDFGTHIIAKETAGAAVIIDTFYDRSAIAKTKSHYHSVETGAAVDVKKFSAEAGGKFENEQSETNNKTTEKTQKKLKLLGGPKLENFGTVSAEEHLSDELVGIRHEAIELIEVITADSLPDWDDDDILRVQFLVSESVQEYIEMNTIYGCRDRFATNFNSTANADPSPGSGDECQYDTKTTYEWGGIYADKTEKNQIFGFPKITPSLQFPNRFANKCPNQFTGSLIAKHGDTKYYWCQGNKVDEAKEQKGLLFGGFYSKNVGNPNKTPTLKQMTAINTLGNETSANCPLGFFPLQLFDFPVFVCVTPSRSLYQHMAVPFGGFTFCSAIATPCPKGFEKMDMFENEGCGLFVCLKVSRYMSDMIPFPVTFLSLKKPPFISIDELGYYRNTHATRLAAISMSAKTTSTFAATLSLLIIDCLVTYIWI